MERRSSPRRGLLHLAAVVLLLVAAGVVAGTVTSPVALASPAPVVAPGASVVTADALPTVQIDGVVWSQAIVGSTVYAGGSFAQARPAGAAPGTSLSPRANLLAYDITTGSLITSFAPFVNGQVQSVVASPNGSRIYIAGDFTSVNGVTRNRIAAFDTATGALIGSFAPSVDGRVKTLLATDDQVYFGGNFSTVDGNPRTRLASVRASDGALLPWAPTADYPVNALVLTPDGSKVIVGGAFTNVSGVPAYGLAAVDASSGAVQPWAANQTVRDAGPNSAILSLSTDGTNVYGSGYDYGGGGNLEGVFAADPNTGAVRWIEDCHGDTYGSYPVNGVVYTVSHAHYCGNIGGFGESVPRVVNMRHAVAFTTQATGTINHDPHGYYDWFGQPSPSIVDWFPDMESGTYTGQSQAAWSVTGNGQYVVLGGEFPTVNGVGQQGLVRFAVTPIGPAKRGPVLTGSNFTPHLSSPATGTVRVAFAANYDQDDLSLTYRVVRNGNTAAPVYQTAVNSTFWNRPIVGFTDTNLTPGATYSYRLYVTDGAGNEVVGATATVVAAGSGSPSTYAQTVIDQGASLYWRFGESSVGAAGSVVDAAGASNGVPGGGVSGGVSGAIAGDPDTAYSFSGASDGWVSGRTAGLAPNVTNTYSTSAWFRTTTSVGGQVIGFGNSQAGFSNVHDRQIYLDNAGRLNFGVSPRLGQPPVTITSPNTYRDGQWHQVVATLGAAGMVLYVDGQPVAARADTTSAADVFGYWRVGGDTLDGNWPNQPTSDFLSANIDEVSVYPTALTAAQVAAQWTASGRAAAGQNLTPYATFSVSASWLAVTFDATGSAVPSGSVASYAWDFGDGTAPGSGPTPSHLYAAAGSYQVRLTLTDTAGSSVVVTHPVKVAALPTAAGAEVSVTPARIADSRSNLQIPGAVQPLETVSVQVTGQGGVPEPGVVAAVVLNVTAVAPQSDGYVTVWPSGIPRTDTSNLNFQAGQNIPNTVVVPVGADGKVQLFNGSFGTVHLLVDVTGYIRSGTPTAAGAEVSVTPARIADSRSNLQIQGAVPSLGTASVQVTGQGGVPEQPGVAAVVLNVTAVAPQSDGYVTVWPSGIPRTDTSNLNFQAGQNIPNTVVVPVGADGKVQLFNGSFGTVHLLVDVTGYILAGTPTEGGTLVPVTPARIVDSRANQQLAGSVPAAATVAAQAAGLAGVPGTGVTAVVLNVTVVSPGAAGFVTVWPSGMARTDTSNLNFQAGQNIPNTVIVPVGADGKIQLFNGSGAGIHLVVDISGYIRA